MMSFRRVIACSLFISPFLSFLAITQLQASPSYPWCVAHRGSSSDRLENSYAAFDRAYTLGAQAIEFDIRHTRDGQAIVMHDSSLNRTATNRAYKTCKLRKAIRKMQAKDIFENCVLKNDEEIPSLRSLFKRFSKKKMSLVLELKDRPSRGTLDLIKEFSQIKADRAETLFVISFSTNSLRAVKHVTNMVGTSIPLLKIQALGTKVPWQFSGLGSTRFRAGLIHSVKKHGKILNAWTIDDPVETYTFFEQGIDLLTSNRVQSCLDVRDSFLDRTPSSRLEKGK